MKRVLLIPSDHGGGKGHVSRTIYLAKKLQASGVQTALVLENKHYADGLNAGIETFLLNTKQEKILRWQFRKPHLPKVELSAPPERPPVFLAFDGLAYQVPRDGYVSQKIVKRRFRQLEKIATRFKPDVLVGDTHFLTFLLGKKLSVPVVQITRQAGFPPDPRFFWWLRKKPQMVPPDALAPFAELLDSLSVTDVQQAEDLLQGDLYLIPASPKIEPVKPPDDVKVIFSGPLAEISGGAQKIPFFAEQNDLPRVYVTIGGGANRFNERQFFEAILSVFDKTDFRVLVTTARSVPAKLFQGRSANVVFTDWVDGIAAIKQSDLVIQHGGYGSTMEVLLSGKPSIVIPFHSEQEGNGRRIKRLRLGDFYLPYQGDLQPLTFRWPFGEYTMLAAMEMKLEREALFSKIDLIYEQALYKRLGRIKKELENLQQEFDPLQVVDF